LSVPKTQIKIFLTKDSTIQGNGSKSKKYRLIIYVKQTCSLPAMRKFFRS